MTYSKTTLTIAAAAVLASQCNCFMLPGSSMRMTADKPSTKVQNKGAAAAAVLAAGAMLQGAVFTAPVDAAMFDVATPQTTQLQQNVGVFGSDNARDAAKGDSAKYDIQNKGSFAKKNSAGGVDYGSPKGTDFGKTAGNAAGVATEDKGTDFNKNSSGSSKKQGSNPSDVASQKARKLAEKGSNVAKSAADSTSTLLSKSDLEKDIDNSRELGAESKKFGGGSAWGNKDVVSDSAQAAKDATTKSGGVTDALKQGFNTWSGKGNAVSTPAKLATKPFDKLDNLRQESQQNNESRGETLSRATASVKDTIKDVNQGGGDQYKGINPEQ